MSGTAASKPSVADVVTRCYEAVWDRASWSDALALYADYSGAEAVTLERYGADRDDLIDFHAARIDPGSVDDYIAHYRHPTLATRS